MAEKYKPCEIYWKVCDRYKLTKHDFATTSLSQKDGGDTLTHHKKSFGRSSF